MTYSGRISLLTGFCVAGIFSWNFAEYAFMGDDAYISFRYAEHLAEGYGLVWNPGEPVEGYTNFLWVLLMAAAITVGVDPAIAALTLGIASGAALLVLLAFFCHRREGHIDGFAWALLATLASSRSFAAGAPAGSRRCSSLCSSSVATCACSWSARPNRVIAGSRPSSSVSLRSPGEGVLFAGIAGGVLLIDLLRGRTSLRVVAIWSAPLVVMVGAHMAFRLSYYGDWLPNTFYAKVSGLWLEQAIHYFGLFASEYDVAPFLPLLILAAIGRAAEPARIFVVVLGVYLLYVLAIGGDRFEFRFLVVVFPWLLFEGLRRLWVASSRTNMTLPTSTSLAVVSRYSTYSIDWSSRARRPSRIASSRSTTVAWCRFEPFVSATTIWSSRRSSTTPSWPEYLPATRSSRAHPRDRSLCPDPVQPRSDRGWLGSIARDSGRPRRPGPARNSHLGPSLGVYADGVRSRFAQS